MRVKGASGFALGSLSLHWAALHWPASFQGLLQVERTPIGWLPVAAQRASSMQGGSAPSRLLRGAMSEFLKSGTAARHQSRRAWARRRPGRLAQVARPPARLRARSLARPSPPRPDSRLARCRVLTLNRCRHVAPQVQSYRTWRERRRHRRAPQPSAGWPGRRRHQQMPCRHSQPVAVLTSSPFLHQRIPWQPWACSYRCPSACALASQAGGH